jgi:hypothetical protein
MFTWEIIHLAAAFAHFVSFDSLSETLLADTVSSTPKEQNCSAEDTAEHSFLANRLQSFHPSKEFHLTSNLPTICSWTSKRLKENERNLCWWSS